MRLHDQEPIGQALRRFKKLLERNRDRRKWWKTHTSRNRAPYFVPKTEIRRYKAYCKWLKSRAAAVAAKKPGKQ